MFSAYIGLGFILFLTTIYLLIIRSLKPLQNLEESIKRFKDGDSNIEIDIKSDDEIGRVTKEFQKAVEHINSLEQSRELFLRNIIHELKTPITKGKLIVALNSDLNLENLDRVFNRLDSLINEMANIEKLTSKNVEFNFQLVGIETIIKEAMQLGFFDSEKVSYDEVSNHKLSVDLNLISIAFKNMIDNGIRYSKDGLVDIKSDRNSIEFISKGDKLKESFEHYTKPFNHSQITSKGGFGLGIYLTNKIAKKHNLNFLYSYKNGRNIFKFIHQD